MANSAFSDATHAANRHSDIAITSVASNDILKFDGTNWVNSTTSPDSSIAVTQSSHGFAVGEALKSSGSNGAYAKAQADSAANAEVVGIITVVTDSNNFTLTLNGMIRIAGAVPNETAGTALFLSASSAGALTATEPSTSGQISKPVAIVTTANTEMILVVYRGETISTGVTNWDVNGLELVLDADGDTSLTADTDDQIDVKISGADDFRFTANKLDVLSGSTLEINGTLDINGTELILDANGNTSITADTDDQIDIKISGADDFRFTANNFNILSGSTITIDSGATITNSGTSTGFGDAHTVVSHSDTSGTGAELETLTDGSNAESLHTHTHTVVSHSDTTATGAELETLTDGSTTALHAHSGGGPSQANQTAIEAETNQDTYIPPDLVKHSPGVAKVRWNGNANIVPMAEHESYGMDSFVDNGVGDHTFTFDTAFSSVNFSWFASVGHTGGEIAGGMNVTQHDSDASPRTTTTLRIHVAYGHYTSGPLTGHNFTKVDCDELDLIVFGDL